MSSIRTSFCAAASITVHPVKFMPSSDGMYMFATQKLEIVTHDGHRAEVSFFLEEGCTSLTTGEPVVIPPVPATEDA